MDQDAANVTAVALHCRAGQCVEAISVLEELVRRRPNNAEWFHQLGLCYSGACRSHPLLSIRIAVAYLERALSCIGAGSAPSVRVTYLDSLGNAYLRDSQPGAAIPVLREAAQLYAKLGLTDDWAREEYNLGNAFCDLGEAETPDKWQSAVGHYRNALKVRTKERDPARYAATLQNLGTAYRELAGGDRAANVRAAIGCYRGAMRVYDRANFPAEQAALHNNLGNSYLSLPGSQESRRRNVRRALRHFQRALQFRNRAERPRDYAITQFNCGQAYLKQAELDPGAGFEQAANCLREAVEGFLACRDPERAAAASAELARIESLIRRHFTP